MSEEKPMVISDELNIRSRKLKAYLFHDGQIDFSKTDELLIMITGNMLSKYMEICHEMRHDPLGMAETMMEMTYLTAKSVSDLSPEQFIEQMKLRNTNSTTH